MEPAASIIKKLGGHKTVAKVAGVALSTVYLWTYPQERGGRGGIIPHWHQLKLVDYARSKRIKLRDGEFAPRAGQAA